MLHPIRLLRIFVASVAVTIATAAPAAANETVLFDLDLAKGESSARHAGVTVAGGEWDGGWRMTQHGQRVELDPGRTIKNGRLEVWFTMRGSPINVDGVKGQWVSLHERDGGLTDEYVQLRSGSPGYGFSKLRAKANEQGFSSKLKKTTHKRCEVKAGKITDWATDDTTVMHVTICWQDGVVSFTTPDGQACACTKYHQFPPPYVVDSLRYAYLGSDQSEKGGGLPGIRFKRVKFVEVGTAK